MIDYSPILILLGIHLRGGKMYKKSIIEIKHLRFDEHLNIGEDLYFLYSYILNSSKIQITSFTDYYYFYNNSNSLQKNILSRHRDVYI